MTTKRQSSINTAVGIATLGGIVVTVVFFLAPLRTIPGELDEARKNQDKMRLELAHVSTTQAVQTEALKTLADVAKDTKALRRDVDANHAACERIDVEIEGVHRRLQRLEAD